MAGDRAAGNPHFGMFHPLRFVFLFAGVALLSNACRCFTTHSVGIMFGCLHQWPTLLTLAMFPVFAVMDMRLAITEERDSEKAFGDAWRAHAAVTPSSTAWACR